MKKNSDGGFGASFMHNTYAAGLTTTPWFSCVKV